MKTKIEPDMKTTTEIKKGTKFSLITFIKEEWKFLIFMALLYLGLTYEFPYVIYTPGGSINMSERIKGNDIYDEDGSISMTYVSMVRGSIPFLLIAQIMPNWDVVESKNITYEGANIDDTVKIDKIYMKEAISNAEYVAYNSAQIEYKEIEKHNIVTFVDSNAKTDLKYGDEIISIDGEEYQNLTEFQNYISSKKPSEKVSIEYIRNNKKITESVELIEINGITKVGISIASISDFETPYEITVKTKSSESGPSGGLMTTLAIYNRITENDITKGKKIMGTGTIDRNGIVGEIGGVKYKLLGAEKEGAEVFLCPINNYDEAKKVLDKEKMNIKLIGVKTFDEVIKALEKIN